MVAFQIMTTRAVCIGVFVLIGTVFLGQPMSEVLEYLPVRVSSISCTVVRSSLALPWQNDDTSFVGCWRTGVGDTTPCVLLTGCKKSHISLAE